MELLQWHRVCELGGDKLHRPPVVALIAPLLHETHTNLRNLPPTAGHNSIILIFPYQNICKTYWQIKSAFLNLAAARKNTTMSNDWVWEKRTYGPRRSFKTFWLQMPTLEHFSSLCFLSRVGGCNTSIIALPATTQTDLFVNLLDFNTVYT